MAFREIFSCHIAGTPGRSRQHHLASSHGGSHAIIEGNVAMSLHDTWVIEQV